MMTYETVAFFVALMVQLVGALKAFFSLERKIDALGIEMRYLRQDYGQLLKDVKTQPK
jgi:hypothetical protein